MAPNLPFHLQNIKSFLAMEIMEELMKRKREGKSVISFSLGEPDVIPPSFVQKACKQAIDDGWLKYSPTQGLPELRDEISGHYKKRYGVSVDPDQILITSGTSPALLLSFSVLLSTGDNVLLTNPHYPCYPSFIHYLKAKPVYVPLHEENGFAVRPEDFRKKITKNTRALLINSPANPTGTVLSASAMKEIASLAAPARNRWVISDEIYHGLVYEGQERTMLEFTDQAFVLNGFSKSYAMTGYRLGYLIAPKRFMKTLKILQQNFFISANPFVQQAGIAALQKGESFLKKTREIYNERRLVMLEGLKKIGFNIKVPPTGAFYIFANAKHFSKNSHKLALDILNHTDVGVTPGIDFGSAGEGYLRFSYATSVENIREGLGRIEKYLTR